MRLGFSGFWPVQKNNSVFELNSSQHQAEEGCGLGVFISLSWGLSLREKSGSGESFCLGIRTVRKILPILRPRFSHLWSGRITSEESFMASPLTIHSNPGAREGVNSPSCLGAALPTWTRNPCNGCRKIPPDAKCLIILDSRLFLFFCVFVLFCFRESSVKNLLWWISFRAQARWIPSTSQDLETRMWGGE